MRPLHSENNFTLAVKMGGWAIAATPSQSTAATPTHPKPHAHTLYIHVRELAQIQNHARGDERETLTSKDWMSTSLCFFSSKAAAKPQKV